MTRRSESTHWVNEVRGSAWIPVEGAEVMPGCLSYVVAEDMDDENVLWVREVWDTEGSHQRSLSLASVQEAIRKARPLISGFSERIVTAPVGGYGLAWTVKKHGPPGGFGKI